MDIGKLLDDAKTALKVESDYALAKALEVPAPDLTEYRKGRPLRDAYTIAKLAGALGRDPWALQCEVMQATEKNERKRSFWRDFLGRKPSGRGVKDLVLALFISLCVLASGGPAGREAGAPQGA